MQGKYGIAVNRRLSATKRGYGTRREKACNLFNGFTPLKTCPSETERLSPKSHPSELIWRSRTL